MSAATIVTSADADAFMRKYLSQPTDVTTRLVFADWLEETGQPHNAAWAYYIRLKAEADRCAPGTRKRDELEGQAAEYAPKIRANLKIAARLFVGYPKSLIQLLPPANITVRLANYELPLAILEHVPESVAFENLILPLDVQERTLLLAADNPRDTDLAQKLGFILNRDIVLAGADRHDLRMAIAREYGRYPADSASGFIVEFATTERWSLRGTRWPDDANEVATQLVNLLFAEAIRQRAEGILLYPDLDAIGVRFRIDGEWDERERISLRMLRPVITRLAVMASFNPNRIFAVPATPDPLTGEFRLRLLYIRLRVRVTVQPSPDGPTAQIDLVRDPLG